MKLKTQFVIFFFIFLGATINLSACQVVNPNKVEISPSATPVIVTPEILSSPPVADEDELVIGAILFQNDNFFETVALGMEDAASNANVDILFRFHEDDVELEAQWINELVAQEVDAILISPRIIDLETSIAAIHNAYNAGIPVVCYNGCFSDEETEKYVSGIYETDQYEVGYTLGNYLADWLTERNIKEPRIGILSCCVKRDAGFRQALADRDVLWHEEANYEEYLADASKIAAENMLQNNPQINILWAQNEGATVGAVSAIRAQNLEEEVYVFGVDISPQIAGMLLTDDDVLQAVSAQAPYEIGTLTMQAALDAIYYNENSGHNYVPGIFYSRDNLEAITSYLETK